KRPPERRSITAACFATTISLRFGSCRIVVARRTRSVTAAAAVSAISGSQTSWLGRSIVPNEWKPAWSATRAQSRNIPRFTSGTSVFGSPMPSFIVDPFVSVAAYEFDQLRRMVVPAERRDEIQAGDARAQLSAELHGDGQA